MTAPGLHLIVRLAGERVALAAGAVEAVIEIDAVTPVPGTPPHVAGLVALRSRVLTVIDARSALGLPPSDMPAADEAIVIGHEGHCYALLVESVDDAIEIATAVGPLRAAPSPIWARVARGIVTHGDEALLVVAPGAFVAGPGGQGAGAVNPALTSTP
jgi:purine-binding chemotaxis protein CheW